MEGDGEVPWRSCHFIFLPTLMVLIAFDGIILANLSFLACKAVVSLRNSLGKRFFKPLKSFLPLLCGAGFGCRGWRGNDLFHWVPGDDALDSVNVHGAPSFFPELLFLFLRHRSVEDMDDLSALAGPVAGGRDRHIMACASLEHSREQQKAHDSPKITNRMIKSR